MNDIGKLLSNTFMKNKIVASSASGDFVDVMFKINLGFNFFESNLPFDLAEKGLAINFVPEDWLQDYKDYDGHSSFVVNGKLDPSLDIFKRQIPTINLKDLTFMQHSDSLMSSLQGYPFKNYSKAYICHLLNNGEMTGNVLLTLHNCFVYQEVFRVLNRPEFRKNMSGMIYAFCKFICT